MSGQSLNGYGFTIGGSGDSWLDPNTVMASDMTNSYYSGSLTDKMIIKCDTLYADKAEFNQVKANYVSTQTLNANYLTASQIRSDYLTASQIRSDYLSTEELEADYFTYDNQKVSWGQIVTDIWIEHADPNDSSSPRILYFEWGYALGRWYDGHSYGSPYRGWVGYID